MVSLADKRLMLELKNYGKEKRVICDNIYEIDPTGIYLYVDEKNIRKQKALILGAKDTAYENGFYAFDIVIPDTYPFNPPQVKHLTTDGRIRFNPNLYTCGKVCLSILGTWAGPAWCSTMNIQTVLQYLRMIMNEDPLRNEPGYSSPDTYKKEANIYNEYVRYHNYNYAIHTIYKSNTYPMFKEIIDELFTKTYNRNIEMLEKKVEKNKTEHLVLSYAVGSAIVNWEELLNKFKSTEKKTELKLNLLPDGTMTVDELQTKLTETKL